MCPPKTENKEEMSCTAQPIVRRQTVLLGGTSVISSWVGKGSELSFNWKGDRMRLTVLPQPNGEKRVELAYRPPMKETPLTWSRDFSSTCFYSPFQPKGPSKALIAFLRNEKSESLNFAWRDMNGTEHILNIEWKWGGNGVD